MQQDNGSTSGQQNPNGGGNAPPNQMTAVQQAQYRATLIQQQQLQAMQAANRAQQQQQQQQQQQHHQFQQQQQQQHPSHHQQQGRPMTSQGPQQPGGQQPRPPPQNNTNPAATQAQMQALQQLFQSNPEQLAAFVNMSREGRFNPEQMNQLRGAVAAAQQAQQMQQNQQGGGVRPSPPPAQQARPAPNQQQQPRPVPQQQAPQQGQGGPGQSRPPGQPGNANPPDLPSVMLQMQKVADPIGRKLKELETTLARPVNQGGLAQGTPERTKAEMEYNEVKQQQAKLMQQFMAVKAQYIAQQGQTQQNQQQAQQQMALQQQQRSQQAASVAATAGTSGATVNQTQALANQNRNVGTPPLNIRPSPGHKVRPIPEQQQQQQQQQGSRPQTPGVQQGSAGARSSPGGQGQPVRSSTPANASPHFQQPHIPPEAMAQRSNLISGPSNASGMAGGSGQGPFGGGGAIPQQLHVQPSVPEPYPNSTGPRPTLNQGLGTNPTLATPAILQRPDPVSNNAAGGTAGGSGAGSSSWEDLLGTVARESKKGANGLTGNEMEAITSDLSSAEFWDALTGKGTGADSLVNAGTTSTSAAGGAGVTSGDGRLLTKRKVQELVAEIDGNERLEGDVEDLLLEIADEFIDSVTQFSCKLAKHRKGDRLEVRDVQLHLERSWNLRIPTPGSVPIPPPRIKPQQSSGAKGAASSNNAVTS